MLCVKAPVCLQGGIFQWRRAVLGEKRGPATLSLCFLSWCGSLPGVHSGQVGAGGARRNFWSDPGDWVTARVRGGPSANTVPQSQACRGGGGVSLPLERPAAPAPPQASGSVGEAAQPLCATSCSVASRLCALGPARDLGLHLRKVSGRPPLMVEGQPRCDGGRAHAHACTLLTGPAW